jgi:arginyl-tRNA synthetase
MTSLEQLLSERFAPAYAAVAGEPADPVVRRSTVADYQSDGSLALARSLGRPPREIATEVLARVDLAGLAATANVSGPGFINVMLSGAVLTELLAKMHGDGRLGVPAVASPETVVIDYSAPNVAKEMHVGHLRSTVIGDAAARLLTWLGHDVRRANHIGDWGTPFGMLIEHMLDLGEASDELSIGDLSDFYRAARVKFDSDPSFAERSRRRVVALQSGDEATLRLWRLLVAESERYFLAVYDMLGVTLTSDNFVHESSYNPVLASIVDELSLRGLLRDSDGAKVVFPAGFTGRDGEPLPIIVRKSDGGYGYGATDLAAIRHRTRNLQASRLLYVVGSPQHQHLAMVFQVAREAGWLTAPVTATHVGFGQVLGPDGKRFASRADGSVKLADLLAEAVARARAIVASKNPSLSQEEQQAVARAVGIGAIKYADLSSHRVKDYTFDWDRMLATTGDTAAYLQYTHARIRSIFRKGVVTSTDAFAMALVEDVERSLALELLGFPAVVDEVASSLEFHKLTGYLQGLAGAYTAFHERCPVLRAPLGVRASRLALCDVTARVIAQGLELLGIAAPERM